MHQARDFLTWLERRIASLETEIVCSRSIEFCVGWALSGTDLNEKTMMDAFLFYYTSMRPQKEKLDG